MSLPSGINFEQLQREILAAESYLRTSVSSDPGNDSTSATNATTGRKIINTLEETKRINILQQLGRRPLGAEDSKKDGENSPDSLSGDAGNSKSRYNNPQDKETLINRLINEHNAKKQTVSGGSALSHHTEDSDSGDRMVSNNEGASNSYNSSEVEDGVLHRIGDDTVFYASDFFQYKSGNNDVPELGISQSVTIDRNKRPTHYSYSDSNVGGSNGNGKHRYLKSKDDLEIEAQISRRSEFTFKPKLSAKVINSNNHSRPHISSRIAEMSKQRERAINAREKQRKELEELEIDQYCTFQPEISKGTKNILRSKASISQDEENERIKLYKKHISTDYSHVNSSSLHSDDVASRLFNEAEHRVHQQKWLEKKVKESRMSQYSFKPTINPISQELANAHDQRPIHERVGDLQRDKNKRLQELRQSVDNEQTDLTFHPSIDNNSKRIAEQQRMGNDSRQSNNVADRLIQEGRLSVRRKQKLMADRELIESSLMEPAKPSKGTEILAKKSNIVGASFEERQLIHQERMKENEDLRKKEVQAEQANMFKPEIHKKSVEIMLEKRPQIINETPEERAARLSKLDAYEMERKRKEKEQQYYSADSGYTFQPKIDSTSKVLGKKSDIYELTNNTKGKNVRENAKRLVDAMHAEECTFHPKINKSRPVYSDSDISRSDANKYVQDHKPFGWVDCPINDVENYYKNEHSINRSRIDLKHPERMARDIKLYLSDKEEKRRSEIVAKELEELKDCTFQPNVQQYMPTKEEPVVVKGLSRHLELQNLKSKLKDDALKREEEVFRVKNVDNYRHPVNGNTIVRPFHFNSSKQGTSKAVVELENKSNMEYTYRPVINDNYVSSKSYSSQYIFNPYQ